MSRQKRNGGREQPGAAPRTTGEASVASEKVAMRAYELYQARGGGEGRAMDDWLTAERELAGRGPGASRGEA